MNIPRSLPVFLTAALLALVACDSVPSAPDVEDVLPIGTADAVPMCCKIDWKLAKPHLNVVAPDQPVLVDLGDDRKVEGRFHAGLRVFRGGADGQARLELEEPNSGGGSSVLVFVVWFTDATVRKVDGRPAVDFAGVMQVCPERGECRTEEMTGTVQQRPNDDEPIWQFHAGGVHNVPARTRFIEPGGDIVVVTVGWHAMGAGMNAGVAGLTLFEGEPVAGGAFTQAGGQPANRVARWDGSEWQGLGGGIGFGTIRALAVHDGDLVAGGLFSEADGQPVDNVVRWDGSTWHPIGSEMAEVNALTIHGGDLIAGGRLTDGDGQTLDYVARWDGSTWQPMNSGMNHSVLALAVHDGDLIAAGFFTEAGGSIANRIARWDGTSWQPMAGGMNNSVRDLTVHQSVLIAGGDFTEVDGQIAGGVARWDGAGWEAVGEGTNGIVLSLASHGGWLVAGGFFSEAGGQSASHVARWNGSAWLPMGTGMNQFVAALVVHQGSVVAGGDFSQADGKTANHVARWGTQ
jgi:hypothetical protein